MAIMNLIQLSQGYKAITRRQLFFTTKFPEGPAFSITPMALVLL